MKKLIVASAQQQMRLFDSLDSYRKELKRFLYMARAKGAQLIAFPGLAGVMAATPLVEGFRINLLRQATDRRQGRGLWRRTRSAVAGGTAALLGANFRKAFIQLLETDPGSLLRAYETTFSELAEAYQLIIVAGSAYLPDANGVLRHQAVVFGPDGTVLGRHNKLTLGPEDKGLAVAGDAWTVVTTPLARIGILLGEEALYPEAGRILAYQGAEILVALAATSGEALAAHVRQAMIARAQENQCFGLTSFLVGRNYLAADESLGESFVGKSGIYAPLEMTPRYSGVLVEMGTGGSEGLLTAELDRDQLRTLWQSSAEPVRSRMPVDLFARYLPALYSSRRTLAETWPDLEVAERPPILPERPPVTLELPAAREQAQPVIGEAGPGAPAGPEAAAEHPSAAEEVQATSDRPPAEEQLPAQEERPEIPPEES